MITTFTGIKVRTDGGTAEQAARLFDGELALRRIARANGPEVSFVTRQLPKDGFAIAYTDAGIEIAAGGLRGLIYGSGMFLRAIERKAGVWRLARDIDGEYAPAKPIRGSQLCYNQKNNTTDMWSPEDYYRFFRDTMYFGANAVELSREMGKDGVKGGLMRYDPVELLERCSEYCGELDLDLSLWYPNEDDMPLPEFAQSREALYRRLKRINYVFPPGGDPGDYPAAEFVERCRISSRILKKYHPSAQMWPSAQMPKHIESWSEDFIHEMEKLPPEIDGIVTGPNRAFEIDTLRKRLPARYPIRFYADITHNVRCEHPVHYPRNDWHFAFASTLGRESINPRPVEYAAMRKLYERYLEGNISYCEGVNDDVNKMVVSWLEYAPETPVREILCDYARAFFIGAEAEKAADGILALEKNWYGDPAENPLIEDTLAIWRGLLAETPELIGSWRFVMCLFRAECDAVVRRRRVFELSLTERARRLIRRGDPDGALEALREPFTESYDTLRAHLDVLAGVLFATIGIQLSVATYHAAGTERGATLDTIDRNITDRAYYIRYLSGLAGLSKDEKRAAALALLAHENPPADEFAYSVAADGFDRFQWKTFGKGELYNDFRGDEDGSIPTALFGVYDAYTATADIGGLAQGRSYLLRLITRPRVLSSDSELTVRSNGTEFFRGKPTELWHDEEYDKKWLGGKYVCLCAELPPEAFVNGCTALEMSGSKGIEFAEFRLTKK